MCLRSSSMWKKTCLPGHTNGMLGLKNFDAELQVLNSCRSLYQFYHNCTVAILFLDKCETFPFGHKFHASLLFCSMICISYYWFIGSLIFFCLTAIAFFVFLFLFPFKCMMINVCKIAAWRFLMSKSLINGWTRQALLQ